MNIRMLLYILSSKFWSCYHHIDLLWVYRLPCEYSNPFTFVFYCESLFWNFMEAVI